ncbi:hypothetical protein [Xanthomonas maliensis]|nr:hypothetical protein [Xanthomonas maliensis]
MSFDVMIDAASTAVPLPDPCLRMGPAVAGITTMITTVTIRPVRPVVFA